MTTKPQSMIRKIFDIVISILIVVVFFGVLYTYIVQNKENEAKRKTILTTPIVSHAPSSLNEHKQFIIRLTPADLWPWIRTNNVKVIALADTHSATGNKTFTLIYEK